MCSSDLFPSHDKNLQLLSDVNKEANKNIEDERAELTKLVAIAKNEIL